jgi:hypothetical protein
MTYSATSGPTTNSRKVNKTLGPAPEIEGKTTAAAKMDARIQAHPEPRSDTEILLLCRRVL